MAHGSEAAVRAARQELNRVDLEQARTHCIALKKVEDERREQRVNRKLRDLAGDVVTDLPLPDHARVQD